MSVGFFQLFFSGCSLVILPGALRFSEMNNPNNVSAMPRTAIVGKSFLQDNQGEIKLAGQ